LVIYKGKIGKGSGDPAKKKVTVILTGFGWVDSATMLEGPRFRPGPSGERGKDCIARIKRHY